MIKQAHLYFSGRVQGVGFRYTTVSVATSLGLKGWVRNLSDGRVEALVEGETNQIKRLITNLNQTFNISEIKETLSDTRGCFDSFRVEY